MLMIFSSILRLFFSYLWGSVSAEIRFTSPLSVSDKHLTKHHLTSFHLAALCSFGYRTSQSNNEDTSKKQEARWHIKTTRRTRSTPTQRWLVGWFVRWQMSTVCLSVLEYSSELTWTFSFDTESVHVNIILIQMEPHTVPVMKSSHKIKEKKANIISTSLSACLIIGLQLGNA